MWAHLLLHSYSGQSMYQWPQYPIFQHLHHIVILSQQSTSRLCLHIPTNPHTVGKPMKPMKVPESTLFLSVLLSVICCLLAGCRLNTITGISFLLEVATRRIGTLTIVYSDSLSPASLDTWEMDFQWCASFMYESFSQTASARGDPLFSPNCLESLTQPNSE